MYHDVSSGGSIHFSVVYSLNGMLAVQVVDCGHVSFSERFSSVILPNMTNC